MEKFIDKLPFEESKQAKPATKFSETSLSETT